MFFLIFPEILCKILLPFLFIEILIFLRFMLTQPLLLDIAPWRWRQFGIFIYIYINHTKDRQIENGLVCFVVLIVTISLVSRKRNSVWDLKFSHMYQYPVQLFQRQCLLAPPPPTPVTSEWNQKGPGIMISHSIDEYIGEDGITKNMQRAEARADIQAMCTFREMKNKNAHS